MEKLAFYHIKVSCQKGGMVSERKTTLLWVFSCCCSFSFVVSQYIWSLSLFLFLCCLCLCISCCLSVSSSFFTLPHIRLLDEVYIYIYIQKPVSFYLHFFLIFLCVAYIKRKYELKFLSHSVNCNELYSTTQQRQADCRIFQPERSSQIAFVKQCKCAGRACNTLAWSTPSTGNCSVFWFVLF